MSANNTGPGHYKDKAIQTEEWRAIPGWESLYEASSLGQIRSVVRFLERPHPKNPTRVQKRAYGGKLLAQAVGSNKYLHVNLHRDNKPKTYEVHRLVCMAFSGSPPEGKEDVNHINGDRLDNTANNLCWVSRKENLHYSADVLGVQMVWQIQQLRAKERNAV